MSITRLNHAVLYVRDAERSADFYSGVLGFRRLPGELPGAVFMQAPASTNDHDLGLFSIGDGAEASGAGRRTVGLYHLAWEVETLEDLEAVAQELSAVGALVGASDHGTTKAVYARDPDGIEFEVSWLVPAELIDDEAVAGRTSIRPLDITREKARYGSGTRGGVGVSFQAPASG
ncbi:MAG: VOC family protein [Actinomycetota bacterium]|nr:VOC family protein [Actinomycetota bacterium]